MTYHETPPRYLTGITRQRLQEWFAAHPVTDEDRAPELVAAVDPDGMVYWKVEPLNEQLAYVVARWIWMESVEGWGPE